MDAELERVHVKCVLIGEPAWVLKELRRRGIVSGVGEGFEEAGCQKSES